MKPSEQILREEIRRYIKKVVKENKEADAEWVVDKIVTALDAALSKKKDYQYVAAMDSDEFKKTARDIKNKTNDDESDQQLKETFLDWLASGVSKVGKGIIDRRAGYLIQAMKSDPKLQRIAREAGINQKDFENKIYGLMGRDRDFLKALANVKAKRI